MNELSPAALAVWKAFNDVAERVGTFEDFGDALAAALRALAGQVVPVDRGSRRQMNIRSNILSIAAELEGQTDG